MKNTFNPQPTVKSKPAIKAMLESLYGNISLTYTGSNRVNTGLILCKRAPLYKFKQLCDFNCQCFHMDTGYNMISYLSPG